MTPPLFTVSGRRIAMNTGSVGASALCSCAGSRTSTDPPNSAAASAPTAVRDLRGCRPACARDRHIGVGDRMVTPPNFLQLVVKSSSLASWNGLSVSIPNLLATSGILRFARLFLGLETSVVTMRRPAGFTSA